MVDVPSSSRRVAHLAIALAAACAVAVLVGWLLQSAWLVSFGSRGFPMQPLSAVACLSLALGLWAAIDGRRRASLLLLAPALAIAASALLQSATATSFGIDTLLFQHQVVQQAGLAPGRPRLAPVLAILLIGLSILLAARRGPHFGSLIVLSASLALGIGFLSFLSPLLGLSIVESSNIVGASRPGALAAMGLAVAVLAWRGESGWPALIRAPGVEGRILRVAFPLILLMPVLTSMLEMWARQSGWSHAESADLLGAGINVLAMAALLFWAAGGWWRTGRKG